MPDSFIRRMRGDRYVVFLTYADYRFAPGGLERYISDEIGVLQKRNISAVCFFPFPTRRSQWLNRHLSDYWGAIVDGKFCGFYAGRGILGLVAELGRAGKNPVEVQLHHLRHFDLGRVQRFLSEIPVAVKLFLHDYYTVCPKFNLLKNDERYCGDARPAPEKCADCASWTPAHLGGFRALLAAMADRLVVVAPSSAARRIWLSSFPEFSARTVVIPHLKAAGETKNNYVGKTAGEPIRLAYVGAPHRFKGWEIFRSLARDLSAAPLKYEFYHFGLGRDDDKAIRNIPVSFVKDGPEAMAREIWKAGIDIVFLWSLCPETYSYVLHESRLANVMLITNPDSGNIADSVGSQELGRIFPGHADLLAYLQDEGKVREDVDFYRSRLAQLPARWMPNDAILDIIDWAGYSVRRSGPGGARQNWLVAALYGLKTLKRWIRPT
jgi:hypothetical protein